MGAGATAVKSTAECKEPTQEEMFRAVLEVGIKYPTGNLIGVFYRECKKYFAYLPVSYFQKNTGETNANLWKVQLRFAKKKLEYDMKYMVTNLSPGIWQISNAGAKALLEMRAGTWVKPKTRKEVRQ